MAKRNEFGDRLLDLGFWAQAFLSPSDADKVRRHLADLAYDLAMPSAQPKTEKTGSCGTCAHCVYWAKGNQPWCRWGEYICGQNLKIPAWMIRHCLSVKIPIDTSAIGYQDCPAWTPKRIEP